MVNKGNGFPNISKASIKLTRWIGTPRSVIYHTLFFGGCFILPFFGVKFEDILLILTTGVSLEAIYLAIFIQMTVNRTSESLEDVGDDIEEIQDDIEEDDTNEARVQVQLEKLEVGLQKLLSEVESLKKQAK